VGVVLALATLLVGCTSAEPEEPAPSATTSAAPPPTATPVPAPKNGRCHRISYDQALAPTPTEASVPCGQPHTAQTFEIGTIDAVVDGHLLAVDSRRVQQQVAAACPEALTGFLGADEEAMRLSMVRSVWFTPTLEESAAGADWYRCDAVAVAADGRLASLRGSLADALSTPERATPYAMCGTAEPGTAGFRRVMCREQHSWRAISTIDLGGDSGAGAAYPGEATLRDAGSACEEEAQGLADDALNFEWGYEWPTKQQWAAGQHYGICWAPDAG